MKTLGVGLAVVLLAVCVSGSILLTAGCAPADTWTSRVQEPKMPDPPPLHVFRQPPDFRLYEPHVRKEFFLYFYEDESVSQEIVTVINYAVPEGERRPRLATPEEHDFAIAIFLQDWRARGQQDRIRYFNERHAQDIYRKNTLIDEQIRFKQEAIRELDDKRIGLDADIKSRQSTGTFAAGDEKLQLVESTVAQRELAKTERLLMLARGQLMILDYMRVLRDAQYARHAILLVENTFDVKDLLDQFSAPERLVEVIQSHVHPYSWKRPEARIEVREGNLRVVQTRDVILGVRDYLEQLREDFAARKKTSEVPK